MNLFGELECPDAEDVEPRQGPGDAGPRNGAAGQSLVLADLLLRGHEAAIMEGVDTDVISIISGVVRKFQVKASMSGQSFGPSGSKDPGVGNRARGFRPLSSYGDKIDGFAFVYLAKRAVYYVHPKAIISTHIRIPNSHWGRQQCDMSFDELLKRWGCPYLRG